MQLDAFLAPYASSAKNRTRSKSSSVNKLANGSDLGMTILIYASSLNMAVPSHPLLFCLPLEDDSRLTMDQLRALIDQHLQRLSIDYNTLRIVAIDQGMR